MAGKEKAEQKEGWLGSLENGFHTALKSQKSARGVN